MMFKLPGFSLTLCPARGGTKPPLYLPPRLIALMRSKAAMVLQGFCGTLSLRTSLTWPVANATGLFLLR